MRKALTVTPSNGELFWGLLYLLVQLLILPVALSAISALLPTTLSDGQINGLYFSVNFLALVVIFRKFLAAELHRISERTWLILLWSCLGFLLYTAANFAMSTAILCLDPEFANVNDAAIAAMASGDYWIIAVGTVALVPLAEELLFRGLLFAGLYNRSRVVAYAASALAFCAIHVVGYLGQYPAQTLFFCLLQYLPPSLCLCWAYARADSILAPILIHTVINTIGILTMR